MTFPPDLDGGALMRDDVRRTLVVAGGTVLCLAPMRTIFNDWTWLIQTVGAIVCVLGPAAVLRTRRGPRIAQLLPGLVLLVGYVTAVYLRHTAVFGVVPGPGTWHLLETMRAQAATQIRENSSPLASTAVLRLGVVPALALVAALVDAYAVVRRAPALAGIPLLALFTICGATAGRSVGWIDFAVAAAGFLVILSADSRVNLLGWGRVVPRRQGDEEVRPRLGLSGRRVGVAAVVIAVLLPTILPGLSGNRLAQAFHHDNGGGGSGLSPFASLRGQLNQGKSVPLATVTTTSTGGALPFYLRAKVLTQYTATGWQAGAPSTTAPIGEGQFGPTAGEAPTVTTFTADIKITGLTDTAVPLFEAPRAVDGLNSSFQWNQDDSTISGATIKRGDHYVEEVAQPDPSLDQFNAATAPAGSSGQIDPGLLMVPSNLPGLVRSTVKAAIAGAQNPYERAKALSDYFRDGQHGFVYSLSTKAGDSGSDLVDFLTNKAGFCQQYAAAMGIMLRVAGIPSRVVLGYTHSAPDASGTFSVTSHDAHAWVEGYFTGLGWIAFDPTPLGNGRATGLPYDPRPTATVAPTSTEASINPHQSVSDTASSATSTANHSAAGAGGGSGNLHLPAWLAPTAGGLALLIALVSILPVLRRLRRRSRFREALRSRRLEPLWRELRDLTVDTGAAWSTATTPRQVPAWLAGLGITGAESVTSMARGVERERYAPAAAVSAPTSEQINDEIDRMSVVARSLRARLSTRDRLWATFAPRSVRTSRRRRE